MSKLFVMQLSHLTQDDDLRRLFGRYGSVRTAHVLDQLKTGIDSASGLVEMGSQEAAQAAIAQLHGRRYRGRRLIVIPATAAQSGCFGRIREPAPVGISTVGETAVRLGPETGGFGDRGGDRPRGGTLFVFADSDRRQREAD